MISYEHVYILHHRVVIMLKEEAKLVGIDVGRASGRTVFTYLSRGVHSNDNGLIERAYWPYRLAVTIDTMACHYQTDLSLGRGEAAISDWLSVRQRPSPRQNILAICNVSGELAPLDGLSALICVDQARRPSRVTRQNCTLITKRGRVDYSPRHGGLSSSHATNKYDRLHEGQRSKSGLVLYRHITKLVALIEQAQ